MNILPPPIHALNKGSFKDLVEVEVNLIIKLAGIKFLLYICTQIH